MDKLREFKIPVKSHMAELDSDLIGQIQTRFNEEKSKAEASKKGVKATKTKKATVTKAVASGAAEGSAAAKPAVKSAVKSTVKPAAKPAVRKTKDDSALKATSRTVIRRKGGIEETPAASTQPSAGDGYATIISSPERATKIEVAPETSSGTEPVVKPGRPERQAGVAQVITKIDLRTTMGSAAPQASGQRPPMPGDESRGRTGDERFDREEMGKLIKQEALIQAKKAAALLRETKIETFNAADFKKRELMFQPKKKKALMGRMGLKTQITVPSAAKRKIKIQGGITVLALAQAMGMKTDGLIKKLLALGSEVNSETVLDVETAQVLAAENNYEIDNRELSEAQLIEKSLDVKGVAVETRSRPPVVTVMGHVDHGKTSLLDAIRSARVAAGEAGGITQHIGAYCVEINGKRITFLDTPGHEAFTAMRARGAKVTDIVVLVVAADDGIMPQTREAINHAKAAGVPIIVAINKMDVPGANPQKVMQALTEFELVPEEWGGSTIVAKVSALKKEGIKELLEMILLQAEILELKAQPEKAASGSVVEARLERGRGAVATLLVQDGSVKYGDIIVAGTAYGRVRAMMDDEGKQVKICPPGEPVEILGLNGAPNAGDAFVSVADEATAREIVEKRIEKQKAGNAGTPMKMTLEDLFAKVQKSELKELPIVIKSDVQGSSEAIKDMLTKIESDKVKVKVLGAAVGGITESDVLLASASKAVVIGFNVRPEGGVAQIAAREGVEIKTYSIIYELLDDVKKSHVWDASANIC
jgi:translation initiation factor IF-2